MILPNSTKDLSSPILFLFCQITFSLLTMSSSSCRLLVYSSAESLLRLGHVKLLSRQTCHRNLINSSCFQSQPLISYVLLLFVNLGATLPLLCDRLRGDELDTQGQMAISGELFESNLLEILKGFLTSRGVLMACSMYLAKQPVSIYCSDAVSFLQIACLLSNSRMMALIQFKSEDLECFSTFLYCCSIGGSFLSS